MLTAGICRCEIALFICEFSQHQSVKFLRFYPGENMSVQRIVENIDLPAENRSELTGAQWEGEIVFGVCLDTGLALRRWR
jgi:hypothetical protein